MVIYHMVIVIVVIVIILIIIIYLRFAMGQTSWKDVRDHHLAQSLRCPVRKAVLSPTVQRRNLRLSPDRRRAGATRRQRDAAETLIQAPSVLLHGAACRAACAHPASPVPTPARATRTARLPDSLYGPIELLVNSYLTQGSAEPSSSSKFQSFRPPRNDEKARMPPCLH